MPLKKPFTCPLSFLSSQAEIDFLIQPPFPSSACSQPRLLPQPGDREVLSLDRGFFFFFAMSIKK